MKFLFGVLFLSSLASAQYGTSHTPPDMAGHPQTAVQRALPTGGGYTAGTGERPASDFPQKPQRPLGDVARENRKAHEQVRQSKVVYVN